jgi:hypothetical protein
VPIALLIAGALVVAVATVFVVTAIIAARRLPLTLKASGPVDGENGVSGQLFTTRNGKGSRIENGWLSTTLTAGTKGHTDVQISGLRVEFSKIVLGFIRVPLATIDHEEIAGEPTANSGWLVRMAHEPPTREANFFGDASDQSAWWSAAPIDRVYARVVADLGSPHRRVYAQVPGPIQVRPNSLAAPSGRRAY